MDVKYVATEMGFEGYIPRTHDNIRVLEAQIIALNAYHLPLLKVLQEEKTYDGDVLVVLPKGNFKGSETLWGDRYKELWVFIYEKMEY